MSNTTTNTVDVPETPVEDVQPKAKKNVAARVFAILFATIAVASLFLPFAYVVQGSFIKETSFFSAIMELFTSKNVSKLFGFLPTFAGLKSADGSLSPLGVGTTAVFYFFLLMIVMTVIFGIITVFTSKKAPALLRTTVLFFLIGYGVYTLWNVSYSYTVRGKFLLDIMGFSAVGIAGIVYLILAVKRVGKKAWMSLLQAVLSLAVACLLFFALENDGDHIQAGFAKLHLTNYAAVIFGLIAWFCFNVVSGLVRMQVKKGLPFEFVRYSIQLVVAGFLAYLEIAFNKTSKLFVILVIVATGVALLQIVLAIIYAVACKKAKKKAAEKAEETVVEEETKTEDEAPVQEYVTEEHVEAVPYEGGPTEGVVTAELAEDVAEEETQTEPTTPAPVPAKETQTAGYDFYNTKSFDAFIATLNEAERNEFTDLFILRCKGDMPEIPEYVVGQPDKVFFRKIFVYLGKYRDQFSDELLFKIYQFSLKMK